MALRTKTRTTKLDMVQSMDNLYQFAVAGDNMYDSLHTHIFTRLGKTLQIEKLLKMTESIEMKGVNNTSDFTFEVNGEVVMYTYIDRFETTNVNGLVGHGGEIFSFYTQDRLFDRLSIIGGPESGNRIQVESFEGESGDLFHYTGRMFSGINLTSRDISPDQEWVATGAGSSRSFSDDGPDTPMSGTLSRAQSFSDIRVAAEVGGELLNEDVIVYEVSNGEGADVEVKEVFQLTKQKAMEDHYYKVKQFTMMYGESARRRKQTTIVDTRTKQVIRESDGLETQQDQANYVYTDVTLASLSSELTTREARLGYSNSSNSYLVVTGTVGYDSAMEQCTAEGIKTIQSNVEPGSTGLTAGYAFSKVILRGKLITFHKDPSLDTLPRTRTRLNNGTLHASSEWHVINTGEVGNSRKAVEYRYSTTKHDISRMNYGVRGNGMGSTAAYFMPTLDAAKMMPADTNVDGAWMTKLGTFSILNIDPWGGFVMSPPVLIQ